MGRGKLSPWKLVVAALLTGAILATGVIGQEFCGLLATFDVIEPGQALARFWANLAIGYALCSAVLFALFVPGARLAARGGGHLRSCLAGGAPGLTTQFLALQAALLWHARPGESVAPLVVMEIVVVAVPLVLVCGEIFRAHQAAPARHPDAPPHN